mgnify:FL=1
MADRIALEVFKNAPKARQINDQEWERHSHYIYSCLIAYWILQLIEIPEWLGYTNIR